jgi:allophanate hydrolase subunit 1
MEDPWNPQTRQVADLLRELPHEHARPGFTARVLEELDAEPRRASRWTFRLAPVMSAVTVAALLAVAISAGALIEWRGGARKHQEAVQVLRELREEHGRLEAELHEMSEPPVVYLGGDEKVDYVLDLGKVGSAEVVSSATPAAYHTDTF